MTTGGFGSSMGKGRGMYSPWRTEIRKAAIGGDELRISLGPPLLAVVPTAYTSYKLHLRLRLQAEFTPSPLLQALF